MDSESRRRRPPRTSTAVRPSGRSASGSSGNMSEVCPPVRPAVKRLLDPHGAGDGSSTNTVRISPDRPRVPVPTGTGCRPCSSASRPVAEQRYPARASLLGCPGRVPSRPRPSHRSSGDGSGPPTQHRRRHRAFPSQRISDDARSTRADARRGRTRRPAAAAQTETDPLSRGRRLRPASPAPGVMPQRGGRGRVLRSNSEGGCSRFLRRGIGSPGGGSRDGSIWLITCSPLPAGRIR